MMNNNNPITFRPTSDEQAKRLQLLAFLYGTQSAALQAAVDALYDQNAEKIAAVRAQYDAAQMALQVARAAVEALR